MQSLVMISTDSGSDGLRTGATRWLVNEFIKSWRKVQFINGMRFVFDNRIGNYQLGTVTDERWEEINWNEYSDYDQYKGTDQGLDLWWRRILQDMAIDPDQEQFFTIGDDV